MIVLPEAIADMVDHRFPAEVTEAFPLLLLMPGDRAFISFSQPR